MTLADLIRRFRVLARDQSLPYLWANEDVTDWLNDAQQQACIRGRLIRDDTTPAVCSIALDASRQTCKLHASVYELTHLRMVPQSGRAWPVALVSREWLDENVRDWRDETREVRYAVQDDRTLRLVGHIETGDVLRLECYRLPLAAMEGSDDEPEIHQGHHEHLIQWALYKAFSIPDADSFDPNRAAIGEGAFTAYFGPLPDSDMRRATRHDVVQHNVAILA